MTPEEALKKLDSYHPMLSYVPAEVCIAIKALREKVEREAKEKPKGPTLIAMAEACEEATDFEDDRDPAFVKAAAAVLRKLDEYIHRHQGTPGDHDQRLMKSLGIEP